MIELLVYLAEAITTLQVVLGVVGFVLLAFWIIGAGCMWFEESKRMPPKKMAIAGMVCLGLLVLMPSKTTLYTICGFQIADNVKNTPEFEKARKVLNIELDKILKETK